MLSDGVSAILQSGLILEYIRRMFSSKFMYIVPVAQITKKSHTTRKSLIFHVLCALFEQIPFGMTRDILKIPTLCGAKNSKKKPVYLVIWSCGFPKLYMYIAQDQG